MATFHLQFIPRSTARATAFLVTLLMASSCMSGRDELDLSEQTIERLSYQFGTRQIHSCSQTVEPEWPFTGVHKNLRLIQLQKKNVLIYDLVTRSANRTIWQPLDADYSFLGDGIQIGRTDGGQTVDFDIKINSSGNLWSSYRFKPKGRNYYGAALEFVNNQQVSKLQRFQLPQDPESSVQDVWMLFPETALDDISVVTRSYRFQKGALSSTWREEDYKVEFSWYLVNPSSGRITLMKKVFQGETKLESVQFIAGSKSLEPLAIAITRLAKVNADKTRTTDSKVIAHRLFADSPSSVELFQSGNSMLTALEVTSIRTDDLRNLNIAWVNESTVNSKISVQWLDLVLKASEENYQQLFAKPTISENQKLLPGLNTFPTGYFPTSLNFRQLTGTDKAGSQKASPQLYLTWIAATNSETAYVSSIKDEKNRREVSDKTIRPPVMRTDINTTVLKNPNSRSLGVSSFSNDTGKTLLLFSEFADPRAARQTQVIPQEMGRVPVKMCAFSIGGT
jgi:hypothetical protein